MPGEFEKRVQQQIKKFHLSPSAHVWDDIAVALNKTKKASRVNRIVTVGVLLLCFGVATTFMLKKADKPLRENLKYTTTVKNNRETFAGTTSANKRHQNSFSSLNFTANKKYKVSDVADDHPQKILADDEVTFDSKPVYEKAELASANNLQLNAALIYNNTVNIQPANSVTGVLQSENLKPFTENIFTNTSLTTKQPQQNFSTAAVNIIHNKRPSNNTWSIVLAAGTTNTIQKNLFFKTKQDLIYHPEATASNPSPTPDTLKYLRRSYYGYHVTAGLQYERKLSNHWSVYTGLQYSYLTNKQKIGKKFNGTLDISQTIDTNTAPGKPFIKVPFHYVDGLTGTLTNNANWVEIPLSAGYTFNPSSKIKLQLKSGFTVAYMFNYLWLIADGRYSKFYYSPALTNQWIVNWHGDAAVEFKNKMVAGLRLKRSLSPVASSTVQPSLYWNNFSLYTTIPLH